MKKKFWFQTITLVVILTGLGFLRTSEFKATEQNAIAQLQMKQSPASIRGFQIISDSISFVSLGIPALFLVVGLIRKNRVFVRNAFIILLGIALGGGISATIKRTVKEPRPYEVDTRITQWSVGGSNSFPSGHTVEATVAAIGFSCILFRTSLAMALSAIWALLIMFSRIVLGVHNLTDILAGIIVGCLALLIVHSLFERKSITHS